MLLPPQCLSLITPYVGGSSGGSGGSGGHGGKGGKGDMASGMGGMAAMSAPACYMGGANAPQGGAGRGMQAPMDMSKQHDYNRDPADRVYLTNEAHVHALLAERHDPRLRPPVELRQDALPRRLGPQAVERLKRCVRERQIYVFDLNMYLNILQKSSRRSIVLEYAKRTA